MSIFSPSSENTTDRLFFVFDRKSPCATLTLLPEAGGTTLPVFADATTASVCHPFSGAKNKRFLMSKRCGSGRQMPM
jgi:hypothetical protein